MSREPSSQASPRNRRVRLTKEQRAGVVEALRAGERAVDLAGRYGVSRQAISLIKRKDEAERGDPTAAGLLRLKRGISEDEWRQLVKVLRTELPARHGLQTLGDAPPERWTVDRAWELSREMFGRYPRRVRLRELVRDLFPPPAMHPGRLGRPPQPPVRITRDSIPEELRGDSGYVAYVTSELHWRIQQRSYELELADYARRRRASTKPTRRKGESGRG